MNFSADDLGAIGDDSLCGSELSRVRLEPGTNFIPLNMNQSTFIFSMEYNFRCFKKALFAIAVKKMAVRLWIRYPLLFFFFLDRPLCRERERERSRCIAQYISFNLPPSLDQSSVSPFITPPVPSTNLSMYSTRPSASWARAWLSQEHRCSYYSINTSQERAKRPQVLG